MSKGVGFTGSYFYGKVLCGTAWYLNCWLHIWKYPANIIIEDYASAGEGLKTRQRALGKWPLPHLLHHTVQPVCQAAGPCWERKDMLDEEILHETTLAAFGWLEMFPKNFLKIQSFIKGGCNTDLSSPRNWWAVKLLFYLLSVSFSCCLYTTC